MRHIFKVFACLTLAGLLWWALSGDWSACAPIVVGGAIPAGLIALVVFVGRLRWWTCGGGWSAARRSRGRELADYQAGVLASKLDDVIARRTAAFLRDAERAAKLVTANAIGQMAGAGLDVALHGDEPGNGAPRARKARRAGGRR